MTDQADQADIFAQSSTQPTTSHLAHTTGHRVDAGSPHEDLDFHAHNAGGGANELPVTSSTKSDDTAALQVISYPILREFSLDATLPKQAASELTSSTSDNMDDQAMTQAAVSSVDRATSQDNQQPSNQSSKKPCIYLRMPGELKLMVLDYLRWPDLNCFCQISKAIKKDVGPKRLKESFKQVESDFRKYHRPEDIQSLMQLGYNSKDIQRLRSSCPCTGCHRISPADRFPKLYNDTRRLPWYRVCGQLSQPWRRQQPLSVFPEDEGKFFKLLLYTNGHPKGRKLRTTVIRSLGFCEQCIFFGPKTWPWFETSLSRWFASDRQLVVKCRVCKKTYIYERVQGVYDGQLVKPNDPTLEQLDVRQRHSCWRKFENSWVDPSKGFDAEMERLHSLDPKLEYRTEPKE